MTRNSYEIDDGLSSWSWWSADVDPSEAASEEIKTWFNLIRGTGWEHVAMTPLTVRFMPSDVDGVVALSVVGTAQRGPEVKRTYIDGKRVRNLRDVPLNEWHHLMVTDIPWWKVARGHVRFWLWYRWLP